MMKMQFPENRTDERSEALLAKLDKDFEYRDILLAEPPILPDHPRMDRISRAAQFAPFAALPVFDALGMEAEDRTAENDSEQHEPWTE